MLVKFEDYIGKFYRWIKFGKGWPPSTYMLFKVVSYNADNGLYVLEWSDLKQSEKYAERFHEQLDDNKFIEITENEWLLNGVK